MTTDDPLVDLVDDARLAEAVAERTRGRLLAEADAQDATLRGTLVSLAERATVLVLETLAGHRLRGRLVAVAGDHAVLRGDHGTAWVALDAIVSVRPRPGVRIAVDGAERDDVAVRPLPEALRLLLEVRAELHVLLAGAEAVRGRLVAVGRDVVSLAATVGGERTLVPTARIVAVTTRQA